MLGRILAEARVSPSRAGRDDPVRRDRRHAPPLPDPADPPAELGRGGRPAPRRARVRLRRRRDPGRPDHPAGRLDRARPGRSAATPRPRPRPTSSCSSWGSASRKDPRVDPGTMELPAKRLGAGHPRAGPGRLAGRGRGQADPPGRRVQARRSPPASTGSSSTARSTTAAQRVSLPDLLAAARRGETMVTLGDGSMGMLPEEWLKKYGMLVDLGTEEDGHLRFGNAQAGLLDALLAAQPEIRVDAAFEKVRQSAPPVRGGRAARGPRRASTASSGPTSARAWAGSTTSRSSASAASSPTTWAWARRSRCSPCSSGGGSAGRRRGRRWPSSPGRSSSTGSQEAAKFTPRLRVLDYTGPTATPSARRSATTT